MCQRLYGDRGQARHRARRLQSLRYKPRRLDHPATSMLETVSPDLGYEHVVRRRSKEFAQAREPFARSRVQSTALTDGMALLFEPGKQLVHVFGTSAKVDRIDAKPRLPFQFSR